MSRHEGGTSRGIRTCEEVLSEAARDVQEVAYSLASKVDDTMMTDLMLTSRRLERIVERLDDLHLADLIVGDRGAQ